MSNSNHRPLSASGVKNDLRSTNGDSFLPDSDEGNESGNTTNTSDEVYDDFHFTNDKLRSRGIDWKAFENSLDCDGELMGWRCVGLPVKLKRSETKYGQMEPLGLLQPIVMTEKEENQQQKAWLVLMETKHRKELKKSHAEITALREENVQLRTALLKAQAEFSHIQAQLDMLKQEFIDQDDGDLQAERTQFPLYKSLMDRGSPGGLTSHLESGPSSCLSPEKISSRRCDKIPGSYMPSKRRILFLHSDLSDSDQVLDPISCDISESDREAAHELDRDTATIVDPIKSRCSGSDMLCQRKPQLPNQVVSSCEDERSEPTYRLVLAGDMGSGKSSFVLRLSQHQFRENMRSTVGVDCQIKRMLVDGKKMALQIWDTAGQERFHSISRSYFRKASGILLLYDITSEKSFLNITQWLEQIEACTTTSVPLCLVGNKADLRGKVSNSHCVSSACGMRLATTCGALFFETSAKDGTNVVEAVLHLAREVKKAGCVPTCSTLQLSSLSDGESSAANCCWVIG